MIINGGSRSNGQFFAKHLANDADNERVTLCEIRNLAAQTIRDVFREMAAIALGTQCRNYFYHANLNPLQEEELTAEQWRFAVDLLERNLGLTGHARMIVEHRKKGRTHRHVIWLRINVYTMRAALMTDDYEKHQATARELELKFALRSVPSTLGTERPQGVRPARRAKSWETFRGHKSGIDPSRMAEEVTALFRESDSGAAFAARLAARGYDLVKGNGGHLCLRDRSGHLHSLLRRIRDVTAAGLSTFLDDLTID